MRWGLRNFFFNYAVIEIIHTLKSHNADPGVPAPAITIALAARFLRVRRRRLPKMP